MIRIKRELKYLWNYGIRLPTKKAAYNLNESLKRIIGKLLLPYTRSKAKNCPTEILLQGKDITLIGVITKKGRNQKIVGVVYQRGNILSRNVTFKVPKEITYLTIKQEDSGKLYLFDGKKKYYTT